MKELTDCYHMSNGVDIPCIGYGTWQSPDNENTVNSVRGAIEVGYRHIDCAAVYNNEKSIGLGIKQSGVSRKELFVTSKLWNDARGYAEVFEAFDKSANKLGIDYLDLYLIHWPNPEEFRGCWQEKNTETWRAMEELLDKGKVRAIGVSNFRVHHMKALEKTASIMPMVNQLKLCPGETQSEITSFCKDRGIIVEAYSPLGTGKALLNPSILEMAEKYGKSAAQICIRWSLQMGYLPLPKSLDIDREKSNTEVFDFNIEKQDIEKLSSLVGCGGETKDPDKVPF